MAKKAMNNKKSRKDFRRLRLQKLQKASLKSIGRTINNNV